MSRLKNKVKTEFEEYLDKGYCARARDLNAKIGKDFFDEQNPHHFTGNLNGKVVSVNLNPKRNQVQRKASSIYKSFEEYWNFHENFGANKYGKASNRKADSAFDKKQVKFFKGAGLLDLKTHESNVSDQFENLQKVFENKLQWELVPFGSPDFTFQMIGLENLNPFLEDAVEAVTMYPRDYIFFNGAVFRDLLKFDNVQEVSRYHFPLKKKDGAQTSKQDHEIINILINGSIEAAILSHYAYFNTPLPDYGKRVRELYQSK